MSIHACAAMVQAGDPDRFLAAMAAPEDVRAGLFVLYAFNLEVAKAPFVTQESMIAEMRLQFWRDTISDAVGDKPVRAHEVAGPLADLIRTHDLPEDLLDEMISARRFDIYPNEPDQTGLSLDCYLRNTAGHLMALSGLVCGMPARKIKVAKDVGQAMGTALWFRAVPDLMGHKKVAADHLDSDVLVARAQAALALLEDARHTEFRFAKPALRAAWQTRPILRQVIADPRRVVDGALGISEFKRRGSLLVRSSLSRW